MHQATRPIPCTARSAPHARPARGLSLVELLCTVAILLVLLGNALPMLGELRAQQLLRATADLLETDLQYARSLALTEGQPVRLSVQALADGQTCYLIHTGPAHACRCTGGGQSRCEPGQRLLRLAEQPLAMGVTLAPTERSLQFDGGKGTVTPTATLRVSDRDGRAIHQIINIMGRVRSCTPTGLGGLRPCA